MMPHIFNIEEKVLPVFHEPLAPANRADLCVGYFYLRGCEHSLIACEQEAVERKSREIDAEIEALILGTKRIDMIV